MITLTELLQKITQCYIEDSHSSISMIIKRTRMIARKTNVMFVFFGLCRLTIEYKFN